MASFRGSISNNGNTYSGITGNSALSYNDMKGTLREFYSDPILRQNFPRVAKMAENVKSKYFNFDFLVGFTHLFVSEIRETFMNTIDWSNFCFYLKPSLFCKIERELLECKNENRVGVLDIKNRSVNIMQVRYEQGQESQEYDLMTNNTVFCWFPILRKCEQMIELAKGSSALVSA